MAYDPGLAERIREQLAATAFIDERAMFGGLVFLVNGNMLAAVLGEELMVRVGPAAYEAALELPHARPMNFTSRPMRGLLMVAPPGFEADADLDAWLERGLAFAGALAPRE